MSISKRILFGNDPADDAARALLQERAEQVVKLFTFKVPTRRRNRLGIGGYWDSLWPGCVDDAATKLDLEHVQINSSVCTKTQADADAITARADMLYTERAESSLRMASNISERPIESMRSASITTSRKRRGG